MVISTIVNKNGMIEVAGVVVGCSRYQHSKDPNSERLSKVVAPEGLFEGRT
jgi:hypothetical protein